ncbi:hypothetical protein BC629DRAFT_1284991 [Irpex lacteus]|nr:hypothetical protein BC629DRAFT_1284991 [Irpex lacteus]
MNDSVCRDDAAAEWAPYDNKMMFLLDLLMNLPRLRISESLLKVFLWILKESGARNVPSFYHLQKTQKELRMKCGISTTKFQSVKGNIFFTNDPSEIIANDWANPLIRPHMHIYPEIPDGPVSELWHADKWRKEMDLDALTPMYDAGDKHFYVNEITQLRDGTSIIPFRWVIYHKVLHAESWKVTFNDNEPLMVPATGMAHNYFDLEHGNNLPAHWDAKATMDGFPSSMPNPLRQLAKGRPLYTSLVDYFGDDVSGNCSKSWNKHWNAYIVHRNLPRALLQQEYHTHFISTSQHATIAEQFTAFKHISTIRATHNHPVEARDAMTGQMICFRIFVNAVTSDNPMQSEVASHIGGAGNLLCRKCTVGGTAVEKEAAEGFEKLFHTGTARHKDGVLDILSSQVKLACAGVAQPIKVIQTSTGIKDSYTQHWIDYLLNRAKAMMRAEPDRSSASIREELWQWALDHQDDIYSGFLTLKGFDPTRDTPIEILHTILLGLVKYGWHMTHTSWDALQKATYAIRLQSSFMRGLSLPAVRANYIMQYANSLIGRQLKTVAQLSIFHIHDLVKPSEFQLWKAIGELSALIWFPEIHNMDQYLDDVDVAVGNVLDTFVEIDPMKVIQKVKLHLQLHAREDIQRFGPLVGVCTEGFESYNAVFRACSILSNRLAPSRDIALQLGKQESFKHRLTGGYWKVSSSSESDEWIAAGDGVQDMLTQHHAPAAVDRLESPSANLIGSCKLMPLPRGTMIRPVMHLSDTKAIHTLNYASYDPASEWVHGRSCIAKSKDECFIDSWVFAPHPVSVSPELAVGRVSEILVSQRHSSEALVVLELFHISANRHPVFAMPFMMRRQGESSWLLIPATSIEFDFNAQHDCVYAGCAATGRKPQLQERVESGKVDSVFEHCHAPTTDRYVVNMHAFHNAHLIRRVISRSLSAPQPVHQDRAGRHAAISRELQLTQSAKRKTQQEKRAAAKKVKAHGTAPGHEQVASTSNIASLQPNRKRKKGSHAQAANSDKPLDGPVTPNEDSDVDMM